MSNDSDDCNCDQALRLAVDVGYLKLQLDKAAAKLAAAEARVRELEIDAAIQEQATPKIWQPVGPLLQAAAATERAAVVSWLRSVDVAEVDPIDYLAACIEAGHHLSPANEGSGE